MDFVFEAAKATIIQGQINPKKRANRTLFIGGGDHRTGAITTGQAQQNLPEASNTQRTQEEKACFLYQTFIHLFHVVFQKLRTDEEFLLFSASVQCV